MALADNIKTIRGKWGESQKDFAARFGMTASNISRIETGENEMTLKALVRLSDLSGVGLDRLVMGEVGQDEIPPVPVGEGGEKFVKLGRAEKVIVSEDLGEFADLRKLVGELMALRHDVDSLKGTVAILDGEGQEKLQVFKALQTVIGYLEKGLDEKGYQEEKKAYLDKLAAILSGWDEK